MMAHSQTLMTSQPNELNLISVDRSRDTLASSFFAKIRSWSGGVSILGNRGVDAKSNRLRISPLNISAEQYQVFRANSCNVAGSGSRFCVIRTAVLIQVSCLSIEPAP